jgi:hypothetical protein
VTVPGPRYRAADMIIPYSAVDTAVCQGGATDVGAEIALKE